ncbi:hypothetical protein Tco_1349078, partial [Tanacetum coccineum]
IKNVALKGELRMIKLGDQTVDAYFRKIESITDVLTNLGSSFSNDDVVTYSLHGLSDKYDQVAGIMRGSLPESQHGSIDDYFGGDEVELQVSTSLI